MILVRNVKKSLRQKIEDFKMRVAAFILLKFLGQNAPFFKKFKNFPF